MMLLKLVIDKAELINVVIGGILTGAFTAWAYDKIRAYRIARKDRDQFGILSSKKGNEDWIHYNYDAKNRILTDNAISRNELSYIGDGTFNFTWIGQGNQNSGKGQLIFNKNNTGQMFFITDYGFYFNHRAIYYAVIENGSTSYDAIFVRADDQNARYVMMRPVSGRVK